MYAIKESHDYVCTRGNEEMGSHRIHVRQRARRTWSKPVCPPAWDVDDASGASGLYWVVLCIGNGTGTPTGTYDLTHTSTHMGSNLHTRRLGYAGRQVDGLPVMLVVDKIITLIYPLAIARGVAYITVTLINRYL